MNLPTVDGFANIVSNIGAANGKSGANGYVMRPVGQLEVELAYTQSTWFGKILDIRADDATREGRSWQADKEQIEALETAENRLGFWSKINQVIKYADLYGGGVIIPDLPGNSASPLNPDRITKGSVKFLSVLHRYEITAEGVDRNPLSPTFGGPERYRVNTQTGLSVVFHPSRVILFNGRTIGASATRTGEIWGESLWTHLADSILGSDSAAAVISALLQEAKIDVVSVDGLMEGMATEAYESKFMKRWQLVALLKSVANVTLIDKDDTWEQKSITWAGLPEVVTTLLTIMAGAADIPLTRLAGTSPKGLNSTGEGDLRNYYDGVKAKQKLHVSPMLQPLDDILIRNALGSRPEDVWYSWNPLWQPSQKERAETQKIRAETFAIELNTGALAEEPLSKAYVNGAIESGLYPGYEQAIDDSASDDGLPSEEEIAEETERQRLALEQANAVPVTTDAAPRTLYVRRDVVNKAEITKWAKAQGFTDIVPDLHVTVLYSTTPVDWFQMGETWQAKLEIPPGGARQMDTFGMGAQVLLISASELHWRNEQMRAKGASSDFDEYQPHITISYGAMPEGVEAYQGKIVLGPEIFEEVRG